jgi:DNA-binding Xre family transcriptional regulator
MQDMVAAFTPEESLLPMTRLTGQSLFYQGREGLKHKLLTIEEDEGMQEAMYSVRTLLSSQRLIIHGLKTDAKSGEFRAYQNTVEGPASVMISTTDLSAFDHESVNRFFVLHLDESREQTKAILEHQRKVSGPDKIRLAATRKNIKRLHQNIQRLLKPIAVINRIGTGIEYPSEILNTRREQNKTEALIEAVALLHQHQREIKESKFFGVSVRYIEVTKEDVEAVHTIAGDVLRQSLDELSKLCRELLCHIHDLVNEKYREAVKVRPDIQRWQVSFTRKEIKDRTAWSNWHVIEHLRELEEQGYIASRMGKQGQKYAYALVEECIPDLPALKRIV